jgi:hypothetical protein
MWLGPESTEPPPRFGRRQWLYLALAFVPLVAIVVLAYIASH